MSTTTIKTLSDNLVSALTVKAEQLGEEHRAMACDVQSIYPYAYGYITQSFREILKALPDTPENRAALELELFLATPWEPTDS